MSLTPAELLQLLQEIDQTTKTTPERETKYFNLYKQVSAAGLLDVMLHPAVREKHERFRELTEPPKPAPHSRQRYPIIR